MKKIYMLTGLIALIAIGLVAATGYNKNNENYGLYHEYMEDIVENGSYDDLVAFREANDGYGGPRWVDSESDFELWQKRHIENDGAGRTRTTSSRGTGSGMRGSGKSGYHGNCPILD